MNQYRYFIAIAEEKSFSKAAKRLFVAQSSLSQAIKNMEEELQVQLFIRHKHGVTMTEAGSYLLKQAYEMVHLEKRMKSELHHFQDSYLGTLSIGLTNYWATLLLPEILPKFKAAYPNLAIQITEGTTRELRKEMHKNNLDVIFITDVREEQREEQLQLERIVQEEIKFAVSPKLLPEGKPGKTYLTLAEVAHLPFIVLHQGQRLRELSDQLFKEMTAPPKVMLETQSVGTAYTLASAGLAVTLVPERLNRFFTVPNAVSLYKIGKEAVTWELFSVYNRQNPLSEPIDELVMLAKQVLHS